MSQLDVDAASAQIAHWLRGSKQTIAFTGAGISTESGIPDFRSPGGVWTRHPPVMHQDFLRDAAERRRYWQIRRESIPSMMAAQPSAGHRALARLEAMGLLAAVVTQNIDELHQRAGSRRVLEIHGTAMRVGCLSCKREYPCGEIQARAEAGDVEPACDDCGGILKSKTVSFGQALPPDVWMAAAGLARTCDLFIAMGSSLVVHPAAGLPQTAKTHGAKLVIINRDETPLDGAADLVAKGSIGELMTRVMNHL